MIPAAVLREFSAKIRQETSRSNPNPPDPVTEILFPWNLREYHGGGRFLPCVLDLRIYIDSFRELRLLFIHDLFFLSIVLIY